MRRAIGLTLKWLLIGVTAPGRFLLVLPFVAFELMESGDADWRGLWEWTWLIGLEP